jgi:hypothetical protein
MNAGEMGRDDCVRTNGNKEYMSNWIEVLLCRLTVGKVKKIEEIIESQSVACQTMNRKG